MIDIEYQLIKELEQYDQLLETLNKLNSEAGYFLARANYHNNNGRYGRDHWDNTYTGNLCIKIQDDDEVVIKKAEPVKEEDDDEEEDTKDLETSLRNRNAKKDKVEKKKSKKSIDPIYMFGAFSVPMELRKYQSSYKAMIPLYAQLINCKIRINKLLEAKKKVECI